MTNRCIELLWSLPLASLCATACVTDLDRDPVEAEPETPLTSALPDRGTTYLRTAEGILPVAYERHGDWVVFQDDMMVRVDEFEANAIDAADLDAEVARLERLDPNERAAIRAAGSSRWPGSVVPFVLTSSLTPTERNTIRDAIVEWEASTPYRFVENATADHRVRFVHGTGCSSAVGRQPGPQNLEVNGTCGPWGPWGIVHEIGHALGFFHEQSRYDRNQYVSVDVSNLQEAHRHNYQPYILAGYDGQDAGPYDYDSIMHYGRTAPPDWLIDPAGSNVVITPLQNVAIGQRDHLSRGDIDAAYRMSEGMATGSYPNFTATLYRDPSYLGVSQTFLPGFYASWPYNRIDGVGDNQASSIRVPVTVAVELCDHVAPDPEPCQIFTRGSATLPPSLDNRVSYAFVMRAVTAWANANLGGDYQTFIPGRTYLASNGGLAEVGNDRISSLHVPDGLLAELCASESGGGTDCQTYEDVVDQLPASMNNRASLVRIKRGVTLYRGYMGAERKTLPVGTYSYSAFGPVGNNNVSSLVIGYGLQATLCDGASGGGPCEVYRGEVHVLGAMNNKASWIKIEPAVMP